MSVSELDVRRSAKLLIKRHGASAGYYSAGRADELLDAGDVEGAATWRRILKAVEELLALEPETKTHH